MPLSPFRLIRLLLVVALSGVIGSFAASAQPLEPATTPTGLCFDVVRGPTEEATGAILVNRCTGKTWILARTRTKRGAQLAYRWLSIATGGAESTAASEAQQPRANAPATPGGDKCFTFQGRRFCE